VRLWLQVRSGLTEQFSQFGDVAEVRLPMDYDTGALKGFGYVVFAEADGGPVRPNPSLPRTPPAVLLRHGADFDAIWPAAPRKSGTISAVHEA
jgi:RNA recognition motif. (a.k.a. RRM, RBD, or RNP domain)